VVVWEGAWVGVSDTLLYGYLNKLEYNLMMANIVPKHVVDTIVYHLSIT
jgi:hypothetical protein